MGASETSHPLLISIIKDGFGASIDSPRLRSTKRRRVAQSTKRRRVAQSTIKRRRRSVLIKRTRLVPRGHLRSIDRRIRTLKKLIPSSQSTKPVGLEGLFRDTADYIMSLQTKVRAMQMMVNALTPGS